MIRERRRRRRSPEQARVELLDAAERVFAEENPREVGLKEVAREAGVSHALITHYFGTYAGLVEATLERRVRALRGRILEKLREAGAVSRPVELIALLFDALQDPVHLRLVKWLVASERPGTAFALQDRGLKLVAREVANATYPNAPSEVIDAIEIALVAGVATAYGYAATKPALAGAIGRTPSRVLDVELQRTLAAMLQLYLRSLIPA